MAQTRKQVSEGITVIKETVGDQQQVIKVENLRECPIQITVDITGSMDVHLAEEPLSSFRSLQIPEHTTLVLATLNLGKGWNLVTKYKVSLKPPQPEALTKQLNEEKKAIDLKLATCKDLVRDLNLHTLTEDHLRDKGISNFVDPFFPPGTESIFKGVDKMSLNVTPHWRRPTQFFQGEFDVFIDEIEPNDIKQGQLGDCWLMCALSSLAERPQLVRRLFLTPARNDAGLYHMRICKNGEWVVVTVDDYFPCYPNLAPIFSRSHGNELWVLLLEKAYAKLCGSYMLLRGGWAHEGMSDLTGCPTSNYEFEMIADKAALWTKIIAADARGALIAAATSGQDIWTEAKRPDRRGGLVPGHAYTVIQAKDVQGNKILNIRNPWGSFEWDGDWCDSSPKWTEEIKAEVKPVLVENDGTFWMSYEDFLQHFVSVSMCFPEPFFEARLKGKFVRVPTVDGRSFALSKFYYCLTIDSPSRVFIGVHQEDRRTLGVDQKRPYIDLGLLVFERDPAGVPHLLHFEPMKVDRQLEVELTLQPGKYIILPRTSGCMLRRPPDARPEGIQLTDGRRLNPLVESTFKDVFRKFDLMISGDLSYPELRTIYDIGEYPLSEGEFERIKQTHSSTLDGITCEGFLDLMEKNIGQLGDEKMWLWLEKLGYDRDLFSIKSRTFMLTIHSERQVELEIREGVHSNLTNIGLVQHITAHGEIKYQSEVGVFYSIKETYYEYTIGTYVASNKTERPLKVTVDVTGSQNVALSTLTEVNTMTLSQKSAGVLLHFQFLPGNTSFKPKIEMV